MSVLASHILWRQYKKLSAAGGGHQKALQPRERRKFEGKEEEVIWLPLMLYFVSYILLQ